MPAEHDPEGPAPRPDPGPTRAAITATGGVFRVLGRTAVAATLDLASGGVRAVEALAGRAGAPATLRVEVVILSDEAGLPVTDPAAVAPALAAADRALSDGAGVRVRVTAVRVVRTPAPAAALDARANRALLLDDVLGRTVFYRRHSSASAAPAIAGPVTVVVVRSITGRTTGCSLGISADWVIVQASLFDSSDEHRYDETVLAHELGHALNLPHHRDPANLMFPASSPPEALRGNGLTRWQAGVVQANRRVIPGTARTRSRPPADSVG